MKRYLLIANDQYYPGSGDKDWIGVYETREAAQEVKDLRPLEKDSYHIIDLFKWMEIEDEKNSC